MTEWFVRSTIWIALACFVAGEAGRWWPGTLEENLRATALAGAWAPRVFLIGAVFCAIHFTAAMQWHYAWDHARAWRETADATGRVYGVAWGWGLLVNYVFLGVWFGDALRRLSRPERALEPPSAATWWLRVFYAVMLVNASVVFVHGWARVVGVILCVALAFIWLAPVTVKKR
jgi:hypothetical protein